jgi:5-methylcytosine-specific restriction protein A
MGRLSNLQPRLTGLPPRIKRHADAEGHSRTAEPWRAWYSTARWRRLRLDTFLRDLYTCQCGCGTVEPDTRQLVADHVEPHRGDERRFWDPANIQTLTKPCHDRWKQRLERRGRGVQNSGG